MAQPTLRITSPTEGSIVNPGQSLSVTVEASPKDAFDSVALIGWDPIGIQVLTAPPYHFAVTIPQRIIPATEYLLTPVGALRGVRSKPVHGDPIAIQVERADVPTTLLIGDVYLKAELEPLGSMHVYRSLWLSGVGIEEMLYVTGIFADGKKVDLTESSYIGFSSDNPGIAKNFEKRTVVATGKGSAGIIVSYRGKSVVLPVIVGRER